MKITKVIYHDRLSLGEATKERKLSWWNRPLVKLRLMNSEIGYYIVSKDITITIHTDGHGAKVTSAMHIKAGTTTNLASTPFLSRMLFPQSTPGLNIVWVVHDTGYSRGGDRLYWDKLMRFMLDDRGELPWKTFSIYRMVRTFGWAAWRKQRKLGNHASTA